MNKIVVSAHQALRDTDVDSLQDQSPENLRQRVVRGGSLTLAVRLVVQLVTWLAMFFVLRLLSPAEYGLFVTAGLFASFATILAEAGLIQALVQKKSVTQADMAATFTLSLLVSSGLYFMLWALSGSIAKYLEVPDLEPLISFIALILFTVPVKIIGLAILKRQLRFGAECVIHAVATLLQSLVLVTLAYQGYGVWALALSFFCAHIIQASLIWYVSGCRIALMKPSSDNFDLLRYGILIMASALVWFFFESADNAVISAILGQVALGYYALASLIIKAPREKISVSLNHIMFVTFCKLQDDQQKMRRWFLRLLVLQLLIACPALIGLALVAGDAVPLILGEKWQSAVLLVQLLAPTGVLLIVGSSFTPLFTAMGRADINFKFDCSCALSLIVAFVFVSQSFGLVGVCLVWLTLYPLLLTVMIQATSSVTTITLTGLIRAVAPVLLGTFFMVIVVAGIGYILAADATSSLRLAVMIFGGIFAYSVWLLAFARKTLLNDISILTGELRWRRTAASQPS